VFVSADWEIDLKRRELRSRGVPVPIGARAFQIIEALVQGAGELVSKDDLMARVWPGIVVEENTLAVHISAARKALGHDRGMLQTAFGRGYRLLGNWAVRSNGVMADLAEREPAQELTRPFRANLPRPTLGLIGRAAVTQQLRDLLSAYRVVTLTGAAGIGKTSLALEVARRVHPTFDGDCLLVELASLSEAALVPSAVAGVLNLRMGGEEISAEAVARAIGQRKTLLILDNCEHVIDAAAILAETLARMCPQVTILATSREFLQIESEYAYRVPPLDVPTKDQSDSEKILDHSAVQLFIARTKDQNEEFSPLGESLRTIAAICKRLDGIPLAIEFAAARTATLGLSHVASHLNDRFRLLTGGWRTALVRHRTLRAALDWSYDLLPEQEKRILCRLAIFVASFSLDGACAVMGDDQAASFVAEGIANLVAKSLVTADIRAGLPHYRLLETTRAYAFERLTERGEVDAAARGHAAYHQELFERAGVTWETMPTMEWVATYAPSLDDVRAALGWAFAPGGDTSIGSALTTAVVPLWLGLWLLGECRACVERALAALDAGTRGTRQEMKLQAALGLSQEHTKGPVREVRVAWERVLELAEGLDDIEHLLRAHYGLWLNSMHISAYRSALGHARSFAPIAARGEASADILAGERLVAVASEHLGDHSEARTRLERVCNHYVRPPQRWRAFRFGLDQKVGALMHLGRTLWFQGFPDQAVRVAHASVAEARAIEHPTSLCYALVDAACPVSLWTGDLPAVERFGTMLSDHALAHNLEVWRTYGIAWQKWASVKRGDINARTSILLHVLRGVRERLDLYYTMYLVWPEDVTGSAEEIAGSLGEVEKALQEGKELWCFPELLRVKGELVQLENRSNKAAAESNFRQALEWARRQGALSWELRAAMSLGRLQRSQGRTAEALAELVPVYERFSEGFGTADLISARALIDELHQLGGR
jgi:predicted ATPase/DNA-binding winged helix-turn-helix (wHTH) protein